MVLLVAINKRFSANTKEKALCLLSNLLRVAADSFEGHIAVACLVYGDDKKYHEVFLRMGEGCVISGFAALLSYNKIVKKKWDSMMLGAWCGQRIRTHPQHACLWDALLLALYLKNHKKLKNCWAHVGQFVFPKLIWLASKVIDALALKLASLPIEQVPLLKGPKGKKRSGAWVNRLVLLQRIKKIKHHRKTVMKSHQDLVTECDQLVKSEDILTTGLYLQNIKSLFSNVRHLTIHWDPSSYDVSTLVAIAYACVQDIACYPPIQNLNPLLKKDLHEDLQKLAAGKNRLTRFDGYTELRALSHCMRALGTPLDFFTLDPSLHWRSLKKHEIRLLRDGKVFIKNKTTGEIMPVFPPGWSIQQQPLLCSITDQGGINRASLDYVVYKLGLPILVLYDPYHRAWNDLKDSMKSTKTNLFKTMLAFSLLWNVNYGPQGSKEWFGKKQQKLQDLMSNFTPHSEPFLSFIPYICAERNIEEAIDNESREQLWESLTSLNTTSALGPLVKIMRWFSWWECEKHYQGENFATKLIMMDDPNPLSGVDFIRNETLEEIAHAGKVSEKAELQKLKIKHGTWSLAPLMVTPTSVWQKDLLATVGAVCWTHHSHRAKYVLSPDQVRQFTLNKVSGGWKDELLDLLHTSFHKPETFQHLFRVGDVSEAILQQRVNLLYEFSTKLVGKRCSSLISFYLIPPLRYSQMILPEWSMVAKMQMDSDFQCLLQWEAASQAGEHVDGLAALAFLDSSYVRLLFLLNEQDMHANTSEANHMLHHALTHLGDTACIESTHSSAKDALRDSRSNYRSRVCKYFNVISTKVLASRKTPHITVSEAQLATAKVTDIPSVTDATFPNTHVLNKTYQDMMRHKAGDHFWHSTSAQTLFQEVVILEWLLKGRDGVKGKTASLSCLAGKAGDVVVAKDGNQALMVMAACSHGFVAWKLEPVNHGGLFGDSMAYRPIQKQSALGFHFICDLDWLVIPVVPKLLHQHGGLVVVQDGEAIPLLVERVKKGFPLTVKQIQSCLSFLGVSMVPNWASQS